MDSLLSVYMSALRTHIDNSLQSVRALKGNLNKTAKRQNLVYGCTCPSLILSPLSLSLSHTHTHTHKTVLNPVSSSENRAPSLREVPGSLSMEPSSMPFLASSFDDLTATSPQTPPRSPSLSPFTNLLFPSATDSPPKTSVPNLSPGIEREAVVQQDAHHQVSSPTAVIVLSLTHAHRMNCSIAFMNGRMETAMRVNGKIILGMAKEYFTTNPVPIYSRCGDHILSYSCFNIIR